MTKLECRQIFAMLSEYLDREIPAPLCDQIDEHIGECPPCVEFVKSLEKTVELLRKMDIADGRQSLSQSKLAELKAAYEAYLGR